MVTPLVTQVAGAGAELVLHSQVGGHSPTYTPKGLEPRKADTTMLTNTFTPKQVSPEGTPGAEWVLARLIAYSVGGLFTRHPFAKAITRDLSTEAGEVTKVQRVTMHEDGEVITLASGASAITVRSDREVLLKWYEASLRDFAGLLKGDALPTIDHKYSLLQGGYIKPKAEKPEAPAATTPAAAPVPAPAPVTRKGRKSVAGVPVTTEVVGNASDTPATTPEAPKARRRSAKASA